MGDLATMARRWLHAEPALSGMTLRQLAVLQILCDAPGPHRTRTLAPLIHASKPVITRATNSLGLMGMVQRIRDPDDGRDCFYIATPAGKALRDRMKEADDG